MASNTDQTVSYKVEVSYMEIYNEKVHAPLTTIPSLIVIFFLASLLSSMMFHFSVVCRCVRVESTRVHLYICMCVL